MKNKLLFSLAIWMIFSVVACSETSDYIEKENTVTIVDHLNRTVTMEKEPKRIVSGSYISTSILIALDIKDRIVGIEAKADTRPIYNLAAPDLLSLHNVGTTEEFDLEGCIILNPDLVILPITLKEQIKSLEDMGITVIGINPENQELLAESITMIAKITGVQNHKELLNYYEEKEKEIKAVHRNIQEKQRVYFAANNNLLFTATKNMYQNDIIEAAGGINVASNIGDSDWVNISYEQLVKYNPEYIIIAPEAKYTKEDALNDHNISQISAIQNNRVYQMPNQFEAWDSPIPSSILGKVWLTSILYKEHYPYNKFVDEVYDFYHKFYSFEINKKLLIDND